MLKGQYINTNKNTSKYNTSPMYQHTTKDPQNNKKTKKHTPIKHNTLALITTSTLLPSKDK